MSVIPVHFSQQHYSALALNFKRAKEAFLGRDHLHNGPSGTPARRHANTQRIKDPAGELPDIVITRGDRKRRERQRVQENWKGEARLLHHWPSHARVDLGLQCGAIKRTPAGYRELSPDEIEANENIYRQVVEKPARHAARAVTGFNPALAAPYGGTEIKKAWIDELPPVQEPDDHTAHTSYIVAEGADGWYVVADEGNEHLSDGIVKGPYQAKKTANRVARTLNGA